MTETDKEKLIRLGDILHPARDCFAALAMTAFYGF
jgi:hypothetical protein